MKLCSILGTPPSIPDDGGTWASLFSHTSPSAHATPIPALTSLSLLVVSWDNSSPPPITSSSESLTDPSLLGGQWVPFLSIFSFFTPPFSGRFFCLLLFFFFFTCPHSFVLGHLPRWQLCSWFFWWQLCSWFFV